MTNPESVTGVAYDAVGMLGFWNFDNNTANDLGACHNNGFVGTGVVLPVNLISFSGASVEKGIQLEWATSSEINNSHFLIQRSSDGNEFNTIGQLEGAGQSNRLLMYNFLDESPLDSYNYYRLIQVDFDGKETISNMISVGFSPTKENNIQVYPNPTKTGDVIKVGIENGEREFTVNILNTSGNFVDAIKANDSFVYIQTAGMKPGLYIFQVLSSGETTYKKVLITE